MNAVPQEITLLRHLVARLGGRGASARQPESTRPAPLQYSDAFVRAYRLVVGRAIPKKLARAFAWRRFHVLVADETRQYTVADPAFWNPGLPGRFTSKGTDAMWQILTGRRPELSGCTEWDALVALMAWPELAEAHFTLDWLRRERAHWMVSAYAMYRRRSPGDDMLRGPAWLGHASDPESVPFSLRFVLMEVASDLYRWAAEKLSSALASAESADFRRPSDGSLPIHDPRHPEYFRWIAQADERLGCASVERAIQFWADDGMLGFDDDHFIEAACKHTGIHRHVATLREHLRHFGRISRSS